ncbi:MAG TPA: MarR family transcriptional regulator [Symbiobacteriaceae bacterium]|nr:MarR family transcriptional regulator [Symbiobacteriaceae bacterium]HZW02762.1 MarR family transcriptional regulator [Anaerolineaceae bacterium]
MEQSQAMKSEEVQAEGVLPLIQLISDLIEKRCDRFLNARYGLTSPQFQLLKAAVQDNNVTLGGLSEQLNCSRGNVTGIVDRLERDQWLKRERSTDDRRVITVRLTEKGEQVAKIERDLAQELASLSEIWDGRQREKLTDMLVSLYRELKE